MAIDTSKLPALKSATVGIGVLTDYGPSPKVNVYGTGFFVSSAGYVMTANHVATACTLTFNGLTEKEKKAAGIFAMWLKPSAKNDAFSLKAIPLTAPYYVHLGKQDPSQKSGLSSVSDLDVAILRSKDNEVRETPFLTIRKSAPAELYAEIAMCGYPSGTNSLNISDEALAMRLSPVMQFGRIAGLMPTDTAEFPYAIQTDIIGTGGSSGSPIIDIKTGEVIAMAQKVLPAGVTGQAYFKRADKPTLPFMKGQISASAVIGLVYGLSHNVLTGIPEGAKAELEDDIPYRDPPKISITKREAIFPGF